MSTKFTTLQFSEPLVRASWLRMAAEFKREYLDTFVSGLPPGPKSELSAQLDQVRAFQEFLDCGRPYCKVFPRMARMLSGIDLSAISCSDFETPFPAFEICLPHSDWPGSILVFKLGSRLGFFLQRRDRTSLYLVVTLAGNSHLQSVIDAFGDSLEDIERQAWSLAISVSLFILDEHKTVLPDLEPRAIHHHAKGLGKRGIKSLPSAALTIGRETELPRPEYGRSDQESDSSGRGLNYAHWRCLHARIQACGPGNKERKRIWIDATLIRPDLPMSDHGPRFKITDRNFMTKGVLNG